MKHIKSTRKYQVGEFIHIPDYGMCRVVRATWIRGMYYYACHEV